MHSHQTHPHMHSTHCRKRLDDRLPACCPRTIHTTNSDSQPVTWLHHTTEHDLHCSQLCEEAGRGNTHDDAPKLAHRPGGVGLLRALQHLALWGRGLHHHPDVGCLPPVLLQHWTLKATQQCSSVAHWVETHAHSIKHKH
jgi:hypothetical protein